MTATARSRSSPLTRPRARLVRLHVIFTLEDDTDRRYMLQAVHSAGALTALYMWKQPRSCQYSLRQTALK